MTEEDARTRWCPFASVASLEHGGVGNMGVFDDNKTYAPLGHCIASGCMAWRLADMAGDEHGNQGFCGLAGKP